MRRLTSIQGDKVKITLKEPIFGNTQIEVIIKNTFEGTLTGIDNEYQYVSVPLIKVISENPKIKKDYEEWKKETILRDYINKEIIIQVGTREICLCIREVYESFIECYLLSDTNSELPDLNNKLLINYSSILSIQ
jgi:hypothetical protein